MLGRLIACVSFSRADFFHSLGVVSLSLSHSFSSKRDSACVFGSGCNVRTIHRVCSFAWPFVGLVPIVFQVVRLFCLVFTILCTVLFFSSSCIFYLRVCFECIPFLNVHKSFTPYYSLQVGVCFSFLRLY